MPPAKKGNPEEAFVERFGNNLFENGLDDVRKSLEESHTVAVYVQYPWCDQCAAKYDTLLSAVESSKMAFGVVDAREHRTLGSTLLADASCDFKCFLFFYTNAASAPTKYELPYSADELQAVLERVQKPAVTNLKDGPGEPGGVSALGKFKVENNAAAKAFAAACRQIQIEGTASCSVSYDTALSTPIVSMSRGPGHEVLFKGDAASELAVLDFLHAESSALWEEWDYGKTTAIKKLGCGVGKLFLDDDTDVAAFLAPFSDVAAAARPHVELLWLKATDNKYMLDDFGDVSFPFFLIESDTSYDADKYPLATSGAALTPAALAAFVASYVAGDAQKHEKSEPAPEGEQSPDEPLKLVRTTLAAQVVESGQETVLLTHSKWGDHTKAMELIQRLAKAIHATPALAGRMRVATYETTSNFMDPAIFTPGVVPDKTSLLFFAAGGKGLKVLAEPVKSTKAILAGLTRRSHLLRAKKKKKGKKSKAAKALVKAINAEVRREREAAEAAAAAERAAREKLEAEFEANLRAETEVLEKVELSGDGGAAKYITAAAPDGAQTPAAGAKVKAHYHGLLLDGTVFDSSVDRGEPFEFTVGQGQVIKCWDLAFASMRVGEKATLQCGSEYAYGNDGSPPKIPGGATLRFDVELLSFDGDALEAATSAEDDAKAEL